MKLIRRNMAEIAALCEKHKVRQLYLFGSILTDRFNEDSDVDFTVVFDRDSLPQLVSENKVEKDAKKQAKILVKEGWKVAPGLPSIEMQQLKAAKINNSTDDNYNSMFVMGSAQSVAGRSLYGVFRSYGFMLGIIAPTPPVFAQMGCFGRQVSNYIAPVADLVDTCLVGHRRLGLRGSALTAGRVAGPWDGPAPRLPLPGAWNSGSTGGLFCSRWTEITCSGSKEGGFRSRGAEMPSQVGHDRSEGEGDARSGRG